MDVAPLVAACPKCGTRFRVAPELLDVANGQVRCGACLTVFDGRAEVVPALPEAAAAVAPVVPPEAPAAAAPAPLEQAVDSAFPLNAPPRAPPHPQTPLGPPTPPGAGLDAPLDPPEPLGPQTPLGPRSVGRPRFAAENPVAGAVEDPRLTETATAGTEPRPKAPSSPQARMSARAALAASAMPKSTLPTRPSDPAPATAHAAPPPAAERADTERDAERAGTGLLFAALGLLVALVVSVFGLRFDAWSLSPGTRGVYEVACDLIGCDLPSPNAPAAWDFRAKAVARPGPPEPLTLDVELVNKAPYRQRLPTVEVRFTNAAGELIAEERLTPRDYEAARPAQRMAPGKPKSLQLRLSDPGAAASVYRVSLL